MTVYNVIALDADGCELRRSESGTNLRAAIREAKALKTEEEYLAAGMVRVQVVNDEDVCQFDAPV